MSRNSVVTIGAATLYLGDCRKVLPADFVADMTATDPPYRLTSGGKTEGAPSGGWMSDYDNKGSPVLCDIEWSEIMAVISRHTAGDAYVMANDKNVEAALVAARAAGLRFHNLLVWNKGTATANRWYMKNLEFVLYLFKGKARPINDPSSKQLITAPQVDETKHPTEKPVALMRHYIENSSDPGALVFDPFLGSGTTGVAALRARGGRRFVGVEEDERWFDVACERISRTTPASIEDARDRMVQAELI